MIEKAVIYNNEESTGICPEEVFKNKKLPDGVRTNIELTRAQMKQLFYLYDIDHIDNTNKFGDKLLGYLHDKLLEGVSNDRVITLKNNETTIPKKYYIDAGVEEDLGNKPNAHRPYGDTDFIR